MFKRLVFLLALLSTGACATIQTPMGTRKVLFFQRGIILQITHTCTDLGVLYQAGQGKVAEIRGVEPQDVPLLPSILGDREVSVTFQSLNAEGKVVGIYTQGWSIDNESTTSHAWVIGDVDGWGSARQSSCRR